jgi:AcrR family transcriptional regulator
VVWSRPSKDAQQHATAFPARGQIASPPMFLPFVRARVVTGSPREPQILAATLQLLQERGYERLTVDAVVCAAHVSKATVYRRWPSKAELVLAAFIESIREAAIPPDTGTLRGDLLHLGQTISRHTQKHASTIRAILVEVSREPAFNDALQRQFIDQRRALVKQALQQAIARGDIAKAAVTEELCDLLPGYLIFRAITRRVPTRHTVQALVDSVIIPGLTRSSSANA